MKKKHKKLTETLEFIYDVQPEFFAGSFSEIRQGIKELEEVHSEKYGYLELNYHPAQQLYQLYGKRRTKEEQMDALRQMELDRLEKISRCLKIKQLKQWISELVPGEAFDKYVQELAPKTDEKVPEEITRRFRVFTESRCRYAIVGIDRKDDEGYLGCVMSNDYSWAGEDHRRGHDLPDGPFNEETWRRIVNAIVANQLRELGT